MDLHRSVSHRNLIAEQPGLRILLTGLVIAFVFGNIFKSVLSPARVTAQIEKAASHIHKDIQVTFDSAQVSLSHGILPRFAVIISNVKMEASLSCWGAPILEIDELRLPVSFWNLLRGKAPVRNIEANTVSLRLRERIKDCDVGGSKGGGQDLQVPAAVTLSPSENRQKYSNDIRGVSIQTLRVSLDQYPKYATEFASFVARVKSFEPKVIEIRAKNSLMKDPQVGEYLSHANLFLEYKESPQSSVHAHYFGNWREGHYSIIANYSLDEKNLALETDLKHIPLTQILSILKKYNLASKELNGRQVWVSTKAQLSGPVAQLRKVPMEVRDLKVEGDLGEIASDRIRVSSLDPLSYDPISLEIQNLDIAKLLVLLNRSEKINALGHLGLFSGRANIISPGSIRISGEHKGLEFVFSNKGQRELQVIDSIVGNIGLKNNQWEVRVDNMLPRNGSFAGSVRLLSDREFKKMEVVAKVADLSLSPSVQKLMTSGGEVGSINFESNLKFKEGQIQDLKGVVKVDSMQIEGLDLEKARLGLSWRNKHALINTQIQSLQVQESSEVFEVLSKVTLPEWWNEGELQITGVNGQMDFSDLNEMSWKSVQGQISRNARLKTEGSWDRFGQLDGVVNLREGKTQKRWIIKGIRAAPVFEEVSSVDGPVR